MRNKMIWMAVLVVMAAGMFFTTSCKDSNPGYVKEEKQTLTERQKAMEEVTSFIDKAGEKTN